MPDQIVTINSRKYDDHIRRTWQGGLVHKSEELLILVGKFNEALDHRDLGHIAAGTVSFEHFWFDRWYNIFRFHQPDGRLKAYYANIAMPPNFNNNVIDYIDLDIDVVVWPDNRFEVLDRDDFDQNQVKYGYPSDVIENAEKGLSEVIALIDANGLP